MSFWFPLAAPTLNVFDSQSLIMLHQCYMNSIIWAVRLPLDGPHENRGGCTQSEIQATCKQISLSSDWVSGLSAVLEVPKRSWLQEGKALLQVFPHFQSRWILRNQKQSGLETIRDYLKSEGLQCLKIFHKKTRLFTPYRKVVKWNVFSRRKKFVLPESWVHVGQGCNQAESWTHQDHSICWGL